jgi:oxygen-independent coproporphyrinogen-3 oxidase
MITLKLLGHGFRYEMECLTRVFFPGEKISITTGPEEVPGDWISTSRKLYSGTTILTVETYIFGNFHKGEYTFNSIAGEREVELRLGVLLFEALAEITRTRPPWGILTGVRPVRLFRSLVESGKSGEEARDHFISEFLVTPGKAELALATMKAQKGACGQRGAKSYSL